MFVPTKLFLTRGVGEHREELQSFELALRKAEIAMLNLAKISSIYPPNCKLISKEKSVSTLHMVLESPPFSVKRAYTNPYIAELAQCKDLCMLV